jgi:hypothetical protein
MKQIERKRQGDLKFARRMGGTNPITNKTLSADEVIGEILDTNNVFIPIAVPQASNHNSFFPYQPSVKIDQTQHEQQHEQQHSPSQIVHHHTMYSAKQTQYGKNPRALNSLMAATCHSPPVHGLTNS